LQGLVQDEKIILPPNGLKVCFVESKNNPGQIGNLVHKVIPAAFTSALSQATSDLIYKIPVQEETLYEIAINNEQALLEKLNNKEKDDSEQNEQKITEKDKSKEQEEQ
jgi:hypothetical protein